MTKTIRCNMCGENKLRTTVPQTNHGVFHIEESTNKRWKRNTCPDCVEMEVELKTPVVKLTTRKCRDCKCFLPSTRYFKCFMCQPNLPTIDDDFIYESDALDEYTISCIEDLPSFEEKLSDYMEKGDSDEDFKS